MPVATDKKLTVFLSSPYLSKIKGIQIDYVNKGLGQYQLQFNILNAISDCGYLGRTIQVIPPITDEIKAKIQEAAKGAEIALVEFVLKVNPKTRDKLLPLESCITEHRPSPEPSPGSIPPTAGSAAPDTGSIPPTAPRNQSLIKTSTGFNSRHSSIDSTQGGQQAIVFVELQAADFAPGS